jgi:hypothetical protein
MCSPPSGEEESTQLRLAQPSIDSRFDYMLLADPGEWIGATELGGSQDLVGHSQELGPCGGTRKF